VDPDVLQDIVRRFGKELALGAEALRVGDPVTLVFLVFPSLTQPLEWAPDRA
jgi:hypothetical protein